MLPCAAIRTVVLANRPPGVCADVGVSAAPVPLAQAIFLEPEIFSSARLHGRVSLRAFLNLQRRLAECGVAILLDDLQ